MDNTGAWDELGATQTASQALSVISSPKPTPTRRKVPPKVTEIIAGLGLRFPVAQSSDADSHRARLKLLAEDVSDIPVKLLEPACRKLGQRSKFLPTASEIIEAARAEMDEQPASFGDRAERNQARLRERNEMLAAQNAPMRWHADGGGPWELREYDTRR